MNWSEYKIKNISFGDKDYPEELLDLTSPPKTIYYRGELSAKLLARSVAIVGSRKMTRYGASVIDKFVAYFAQENITTVSGYMYGVDTEVHARTMEYGGRTVAVLGSGINQPYPPENDKLYTKIVQTGGAVLSELTPEAKPKLWTFPERNRIIAALATIGLLVIEASEKSGSMITVNYARKLKKKIFAIPGPITSSVSTGTNYLIKKGIAELVTTPEDIVGAKSRGSKKDKVPALNTLEKKIYDILRNEEMSIDEIGIAVNEEVVVVSATISLMTMKGLIKEASGKFFVG